MDMLIKVPTPGFPTDMTAVLTKSYEATDGVMPRELVPQQRMGNEEELAGSILYLASKVRRPRSLLRLPLLSARLLPGQLVR